MILGSLKVSSKVKFTKYFYGKVEDIQGKQLPIMGNDNGVFTCIVKGGGLVEINPKDIYSVELYKTPVDPLELVECLISTLGCKCTRGCNSPPN